MPAGRIANFIGRLRPCGAPIATLGLDNPADRQPPERPLLLAIGAQHRQHITLGMHPCMLVHLSHALHSLFDLFASCQPAGAVQLYAKLQAGGK